MAGAILGRGLERVPKEGELPVASHHGGVDASTDGLRAGPNPKEAVGANRRVLPLEREGWKGIGVDRVAKQSLRGLTQEDLAGLGGLFEARRDVDRVPRDERLPAGRIARDHLTGVDAGPGEDPEAAVPLELLVQPLQPLAQLECCPDGAQGVVFVQDRDAEHGHHRVADELLHRPAVRFERRLHLLEVARHDPAE